MSNAEIRDSVLRDYFDCGFSCTELVETSVMYAHASAFLMGDVGWCRSKLEKEQGRSNHNEP